ncbi:MAG: PAS domain-containing protein [Sandaracinaceae bacterium]|nr:PAS domain-containing protein [Sandaracinaceae bacterium]
MRTEDDGAGAVPGDGLTAWLDRHVPATVKERGDPDALRRARLLVGGCYLIAGLALFFIPITWWSEGLTINIGVLVFGAVGSGAAPLVLSRTGSMPAATTMVLVVVALTLWTGAGASGGFEGSLLRFMGVVPLIATFLVNVRLGIAFALVMAGSIEVFYYLDANGFPFGESPDPEMERWFSAQAVVSELLFITVFAWLFESSRKRSQAELRRSESRLRTSLAHTETVLDSMADGLASFDERGRLVDVNAALLRLFGASEHGGVGAAHDVLPPELSTLVARCLESHGAESLRIPLPGDRVAAAVASPIFGGDELVGATGAVVILRDVTLETEIDRMKTDFIASVSHELRTPLTSILGFTKLTRNKLEGRVFEHVPSDDAKATKAVATVRGNLDVVLVEGDRLTKLINDVLDISKMEAGRMEWNMVSVDPRTIVERTVAATSALFVGRDVGVRVEVEEELPTITGDADRLQQVMINLVSNAAKMTTEGHVTIAARAVRNSVELSVTDTGPGIEPALHQAIFEKFRQVGDVMTQASRGTGLGLPICRQIVLAHGGRIWVESAPGEGARFVVLLWIDGPSDA